MCGIIGYIGNENAAEIVLKGLKRLEYRGYDSWGILVSSEEPSFIKRIGAIGGISLNYLNFPKADIGIGHTRWATTGVVNEVNAHPHFNSKKTIFIVHNGIIENYEGLKENLEMEGYMFNSQTDTEVIPHFLDREIKLGKTMKEALQMFARVAKGTYAIIVVQKDKDELYALKKDSPLALGICEDGYVVGSDIYAFSDKTNKAIFFDDGELACITPETYDFFDVEGEPIRKQVQEFEWSEQDGDRAEYPHYMIKEIKEQPLVSKRLLDSLKTLQKDNLDRLAEKIKSSKKVFFLAAGTSYHASLIGVYLLNRLGIEARTVIASEFENYLHVDNETLIIPLSQSGETMDLVTVLKPAIKKGAKVASVVNVPHSTIQRLSEFSIETLAGQEVCVASTKTFTNQLIVLYALAKKLGYDIDLDKIPDKIKSTIEDNEEKIKESAKELADKKDMFILGRSVTYPMAREIALKLKEIDYIHAEGMMGGELKHGTIALIEEGTPVIGLVADDDLSMISNLKEVESRGAKNIIISNKKGDFITPDCDDSEFAIYCGIIGHLLSYYIGVENNLEIDKPRNLAKSVTVN